MSGEGGGADRRTSTRIDTHQHVVFSDHRATGPLRTGTAVDRSTGGLRIVTAFPEPVGATLQIELQQSGGRGVSLLEGRVMHVVPTENGLYAMGIRLASKLLRPPAPNRVSGAPAQPRVSAMRSLDVTVGVPGDTLGAAAATLDREAVTFRRVNDPGHTGSWVGLVAVIALLFVLLLLVFEAIKEQRRSDVGIDHSAVFTYSGEFKPIPESMSECETTTEPLHQLRFADWSASSITSVHVVASIPLAGHQGPNHRSSAAA